MYLIARSREVPLSGNKMQAFYNLDHLLLLYTTLNSKRDISVFLNIMFMEKLCISDAVI